jgi:ubiquinone/menaquinone biosynthesis C-methylase UbiE
MEKKSDVYIPALSYDWLTPLYDLFIRWTMPESAFKRHLVEQARISQGHRILDLGCGTATLTILIKKMHPDTEVVGLDGDSRILEIARRKAAREGLEVKLDEGMSDELPYADNSFDRVLSSLFFHHLTRENKARTLAEVFRILRPGGELHVADFGKPQNALMKVASLPWQVFDGWKTTADNAQGRMPSLFRASGFREVCETARYMTLFGTLSLYRGYK